MLNFARASIQADKGAEVLTLALRHAQLYGAVLYVEQMETINKAQPETAALDTAHAQLLNQLFSAIDQHDGIVMLAGMKPWEPYPLMYAAIARTPCPQDQT